MNKQKVLLSVSLLALLGAVVALGDACSSSTTSNPYGGSSSSGGTTSSSSGVSSSSSGAGSSSGDQSSSGGGSSSGSSSGSGGGTTFLVDDMASGSVNATGGYWYTFSDRTVPNSEPAVLALVDGGTLPGTCTPPEGAVFPATVGAGPTLADGSTANFREFTAGGESTWGAGFGMDFNSNPPTGSDTTPFSSCTTYVLPDGGNNIFDDNAIDSGVVGIVNPYDASAYTGVSFWIKAMGTGTPPKVIVNIDDDQTSPWGGVCGACVNTAVTKAPFECSNSWAYPVLTTTSWTQVKVPFASMKPDSNWNNQGLKVGGIDKNKLYNLHWKFETAAGTALPAVDVAVAYVELY